MRGPQDEVIPLHAPFEIVLRGFNRQQVIDHMESLEGQIAMIAADRDAALRQAADLSRVLEHLRREAEESTGRLQRLQRSSLGGVGVRIQHMLQLAEDEIAALRADAQHETRTLREHARAEADRLLRDTTARCERLEAESAERRNAAETESAQRCRRAEQDSEHRRRTAEQQSEQDIARREAEAQARISNYQTGGIAALHLVMSLAGQQLSSRLAEVEREVSRFTELRAEVTARLSSAHRVLVEAVGQTHQSGEQGHDGTADSSPGPGPAVRGPATGDPPAGGPATGDLAARDPAAWDATDERTLPRTVRRHFGSAAS